MKLINKGIVYANPRKLHANYTLEPEYGLKDYPVKNEYFVRTAQSFLKVKYTVAQYHERFGGERCIGQESGKYRPIYTLEVKLVAWFINLLGED